MRRVRLSRSSEAVDPAERVRDFARAQVRAGLLDEQAVLDEVTRAAADELAGDSPDFAAEAVRAARTELAVDEADWPETTDYDRLQAVFAELESRDVAVLQGVDDHWTAKGELERRDDAGERLTGIAWFTAPDVWHAIDHGMLEVNLWHGDTANVAPGDELLDSTLERFEAHGLRAHFDEGRIEVTAHWLRRVATA